VLKSAMPGIITGLLVGIAISVGETAPLLYTAGWNQANPTSDLTHHQIGFLTYPVFSFFDSPVRELQVLSYDAALLLLVFVLAIIIVGRVIISISRRNSE
jgi:phosphate transport system permease protein